MLKSRWLLVEQVRGSQVIYYKQSRNKQGVLERTYLKRAEFKRLVKGFEVHTVAVETTHKIEFNRGR